MRALIPFVFVASPAMAWLDFVDGPCVQEDGVDICQERYEWHEEFVAGSPRELAPGLFIRKAKMNGSDMRIELIVAADLRLPDATGFARLACSDELLDWIVTRGDRVIFVSRENTLATVTSCEKAP